MVLALASTARAETTAPTAAAPAAAEVPAAAAKPIENSDAGIPILPLVTLHNRGSFRFRMNTFFRPDLGLPADSTVDPSCAPATSSATPRAKSYTDRRTTVPTANIRLRWEPTLRIAEIVTVNAIVDALDNLVLGQTPTTDSVAAPLSVFSRSQRAPTLLTAFKNSVRVKAAWAELNLLDIVQVAGGRMPEHFGLGIVRSGGRDPDSDFGDYVDGIFGKINPGITWLRLGLEFPGEGVTSAGPYGYYVQPYDLDQSDDGYRWVFGVDTTPSRKSEFDARALRLAEHKPVWDWGWYNAITMQKISSDLVIGGSGAAGTQPSLIGQAYDDYTLVPRDAFFWTPSLWGKVVVKPRADMTLRVEAEAAMTYGYVGYVQSERETTKSRKDFLSFGAALEAQLDFGRNQVKLMTGVASGGNTLGSWGILDQNILAASSSACYNREHPTLFRTKNIHHFVFNRDYRVDSILFREVIGSVTNAFYFKPSYDRTFYDEGDWKVGGGLSLLAAFASIPEGTPGGTRPLGVEGGLDIWAKWGRYISLRADGNVLFPLSGLDAPNDGATPQTAGALRIQAIASF
jgi:uncharacterized protein (TIGR04551 family)